MMLLFGTTISHSSQETFDLARSIGDALTRPMIFFLEGKLGAGKTVFAKGLICGLGQPDPDDVASPSFTLINEYDLRLKVFHIDLYRLETREDLRSLDLEEIFAQPAVILVEWAEKLNGFDLDGVMLVKIEDLGNDERRIEIRPVCQ
ncbi:MAG: tRNA (adenosine(37)-N6)-threonylcarbamoyltransferase complex ATPase subunit type 1 TsaE [Acidobacteria bacterium]|nr:tRNA (adenosine(37)-N6)-threonylcarbamoyltransferase complex ATPase subunit type 1 TsaE [Acidobacteriota bacterium]MCI0717448.1 tRNA (adenosine(37)-N6)-threonylcarbamoyltransferase complex ATPase subunit type 1 TsaE [Acidobacteriota bacterium]